MSLAADNKKLRTLLKTAADVLDHRTSRYVHDQIVAALATVPEPSVHEVEIGAVDKVAVILSPDDAAALRKFIDSTEPIDSMHELSFPAWERIADALRDGLAAYHGPDEDDGRAFTDASGKPHYEP